MSRIKTKVTPVRDLFPLTTTDVLNIHNFVVKEFAETPDPVTPSGVKDEHLFEAAVFHQHTGYAGALKYPEPKANAAALTYALCNNHAFHNGNKRTALVAMLVHLDRHRFVLRQVSHNELERMIVDVANHSLVSKTSKRRKDNHRDSDAEVGALKEWIDDRANEVTRGERSITYRQFRRILQRFEFDLDNHGANTCDIVKLVKRRRLLGFGEEYIERRPLRHRIGYTRETDIVPVRLIKEVREMCQLQEIHGCDSRTFYDEEAIVDGIVNQYRQVLRRLAHK